MPRSPAPDHVARLRSGRGAALALGVGLSMLAAGSGHAAGQVLDDTLVPAGQLRLQAHPVFSAWDRRFGRADDGSTGRERLGIDLTDPTGLSPLPGTTALIGFAESMTGSTDYAPTVGAVEGRLSHDVTRIEFGGHLGVLDWLTIGVVVPWTQTRTAVDLSLVPDTAGGADLGVNPVIASGAAVDGYLAALDGAGTSAQANAAAACASGPSASCSSAQALADRATSLLASARGAYGASALFPLTGSAMAASMAAISSGLDADLVAAGLPGIGVPMVFASEVLTADLLRGLPATAGAGIDGMPVGSRRGLWQTGDVEVSALVRLLAIEPEDRRSPSLRVSAGFLARLPTGTPEDPDVFLDVGTGDGQSDLEARVVGAFAWGPLALGAGARYGVQQSTVITKRVAAPEVPVPDLATRAAVRWRPASYLHFEAAPSLRLTEELILTGAIRYFEKGRDRFELVDPTLPLDPGVLGRESGITLLQVGGGLRYDTVRPWLAGEASRPLEIHLRLVHSIAGSGGQTPVETRLEAGIRLFKRFWGPEPTP